MSAADDSSTASASSTETIESLLGDASTAEIGVAAIILPLDNSPLEFIFDRRNASSSDCDKSITWIRLLISASPRAFVIFGMICAELATEFSCNRADECSCPKEAHGLGHAS